MGTRAVPAKGITVLITAGAVSTVRRASSLRERVVNFDAGRREVSVFSSAVGKVINVGVALVYRKPL